MGTIVTKHVFVKLDDGSTYEVGVQSLHKGYGAQLPKPVLHLAQPAVKDNYVIFADGIVPVSHIVMFPNGNVGIPVHPGIYQDMGVTPDEIGNLEDIPNALYDLYHPVAKVAIVVATATLPEPEPVE